MQDSKSLQQIENLLRLSLYMGGSDYSIMYVRERNVIKRDINMTSNNNAYGSSFKNVNDPIVGRYGVYLR